MIDADRDFMWGALALAREGLGRTAPNPTVGCVIVRDGAILAAARTGDGGRPHAEEEALRRAGGPAAGATAYVTLEPCGRRSNGGASCAALLAAARIARAVVAVEDPHPHASGRGLALLVEAGVAVDLGVCAEEAAALNAGFFALVRTGRPLLGVSPDGAGFDAPLTLAAGESLDEGLDRAGRAGLTRVWLPPDEARRLGLLRG